MQNRLSIFKEFLKGYKKQMECAIWGACLIAYSLAAKQARFQINRIKAGTSTYQTYEEKMLYLEKMRPDIMCDAVIIFIVVLIIVFILATLILVKIRKKENMIKSWKEYKQKNMQK